MWTCQSGSYNYLWAKHVTRDLCKCDCFFAHNVNSEEYQNSLKIFIWWSSGKIFSKMKKSILPLCQKFEATNIFLLFGPIPCAIFRRVRISSELMLSTKIVDFVEITGQMFCLYAVAFLFSKATKFDFLLWFLRPMQKDNFSFFLFYFSAKNWNYGGVLIKKMARNMQHTILWPGLTKWHCWGAAHPSKAEAWRVFWPLQCVKMRVHLQLSVNHLEHWRA